jgi:hypothetical protein
VEFTESESSRSARGNFPPLGYPSQSLAILHWKVRVSAVPGQAGARQNPAQVLQMAEEVVWLGGGGKGSPLSDEVQPMFCALANGFCIDGWRPIGE